MQREALSELVFIAFMSVLTLIGGVIMIYVFFRQYKREKRSPKNSAATPVNNAENALENAETEDQSSN